MKEQDVNEAMKEATGRELLADLWGWIEIAEHLFKDKECRFLYSEGDDERKPCFRIILNEELCLWWFKRNGKWKYDGYEVGGYTSKDGEEAWSKYNL